MRKGKGSPLPSHPFEINDEAIAWKDYPLTRRAVLTLTKKTIARVLHSEKSLTNQTVHILFLNDSNIRKLNRQFRHIDRATDVLSFPMHDSLEEKNAAVHLGDLAISLDTAERNAKRYRTTLPKELKRLLVHGILHLLGYDHVKKGDRAVMRAREATILATPETGQI